MNIGIVTITSMPSWGGAEIYLNRLNNFLNKEGHTSQIYTGIPQVEGYDNGSPDQVRLILPALTEGIKKHGLKHGGGVIFNDPKRLEEHTNTWLDILTAHLETEPKKDIGIIYIQTLYYPNNDANLILDRLRPYFRQLITTSFDIEPDYIRQLLISNCENPKENLLETFDRVKETLRDLEIRNPFNLMQKQNISEVPYHLHLCHFHQEIMSYLKPSKGHDFVLHPILGDKWISGIDYGNHYQPVIENPSDYTIGVINPLLKKGRDIIGKLIAQTPYNFLILQGGWGGGGVFLQYLQDEYGTTFPDRVRLGDYSQDIIGYYDSINTFLFPSWIEGYGQVGHEALMRRVPVITTDYPAIKQATIGKAKYVPLNQYEDVMAWRDALKDVFDNQEYWHFECNDAALMLLNRTKFNGEDFIRYLEVIKVVGEKTHHHTVKKLMNKPNLLED